MLNKFEWDFQKAEINLKKHGISFEEAMSCFFDSYAKVFYDKSHSIYEERYVLIGFSKNNRLLFVSYTERNESIRIISSRKATHTERQYYENKNN